MNPSILNLRRRLLAVLTLAAVLPMTSQAAPGAHGPNGEHLDQQPVVTGSVAVPRLEAKSDSYELVASLEAGQLVILVDRYETNEPVLGARLEVESGPHKALAAFRPDSGDYTATDASLLEALASPGEHALVFTLATDNDADLLDGTLVTGPLSGAARAGGRQDVDDHGHAHDHELERAALIGGGVLVLGALAAAAWRCRRTTSLATEVK
ncbi:MAG TPA: hypothetical protein PLZ11_15815 [Thauera sp.]|uniref:hypothetical protein n=1 Tax=Thauera sp. WB-2 TaxID=2897772 RepID=UPI0022DE2EC9|nr:hypothetical protein [Thauera sp. WB-2]WBL64146.1 hypothetical protein LQF09_19100 [Thauera sp. WB-2]HRJ25413.1 hypothetical protein [Thauera sp.]HRK11925.1 hypothetical protein [Thauera sp.]